MRTAHEATTLFRQALIPTLTAPAPTGFASFSLAPSLLRAIEALDFRAPRPIQARALPAALRGRDVLGLAQTGTGKTAAFALPILQRLFDSPRRADARGVPAPRALVMAPTRELAAQIQAEFERLARYTQIRVTTLFGGVPQGAQVRALRAQPEVVVACPGRLLDLLTQRALRLDAVEVLVLDEADHMFDMGFLPDLRRILAALPKTRQNLFFSATMPTEVRRLAKDVLRSPEVVEVDHQGPPETIAHALVHVNEGDKVTLLERLLGREDFRSGIVFLRTKRRAKRLAERLARSGHRAIALQGNLSQSQRERAMDGFREGRFDVLVATDIAARGIDVSRVSHVVNFDLPTTPEAYTHRIGRTGRGDMHGSAFSFATAEDAPMVRAIERHLGTAIPFAKEIGPTGRGASAQQEEGARRPSHLRVAPRAPQNGDANPARAGAEPRRAPGPRVDFGAGLEGAHGRDPAKAKALRRARRDRSGGARAAKTRR